MTNTDRATLIVMALTHLPREDAVRFVAAHLNEVGLLAANSAIEVGARAMRELNEPPSMLKLAG